MEHLRLDNQRSPAVTLDPDTQHIFHYVWIRGRCSLVELFPVFARRIDDFLVKLENLIVQGHLHTDLKSIWAREKQVIFTKTPVSRPTESKSLVLDALNKQKHFVGKDFTYEGSLYIDRNFQLQWHAMSMKPGDEFYLDHFEDFRGRIYCEGHILTYQGTDFQKSLIRCKPYDVDQSTCIGPMSPEDASPLDWLQMDVARSYGLDKATWAERWEWSQANVMLPMAKEPFLYKSAYKALLKVCEGQPIDHLISLDATASGIQCLALMAQDPVSALAVNLGSDHVNNPYQRVKEHMGDYDYEKVKQAVMTSFYESVATPRELFGEEYDKFVMAARTMLPGPWIMKDAIASCMNCSSDYRWVMMDGYEVHMEVTSPTECTMDLGAGHKISWIEHRKAAVKTKGLTANVTHSLDALVLREVLRRTHQPFHPLTTGLWYPDDQLTPFQQYRDKDLMLLESIIRWERTQFVTFEILDHVDASNQHLVPEALRTALDTRTVKHRMYIQPIHDCYRVKATDASDLFVIVREVMADLAFAKTAAWILPQLGYQGKVNDSEAKRTGLRDQVLNSLYLIC